MRTRHKTERTERSVMISIAIGVLAAMLILLAGAMVMTTLFLNETVGLSNNGVAAAAVTLLAAFVGSFAAIKVAGGEKRLLAGGCTALVMIAVIVGANVLFLDSSFQRFWGGAAAVLVGALLSLLLTGQRKMRSARHRKVRSR